MQLTTEKLKSLWENLKEFDVLFNDVVHQDPESFVRVFLSGNGDDIVSNGLIWEVDDVGILYITDISRYQATAHFSFWDRRIKGREELIRRMIRWVFDNFGFHRLTVEVPLYASPWLSRAVERIGFTKEGRRREVVPYKGQWFDTNIYSILEHEVER